MLVIHIGMPKTGTTTLQRALASATDVLEAAGVLYPRILRNRNDPAHHALSEELVNRNDLQGPQAAEFFALLASAGSRQILISSEAFTNLLNPRRTPTLVAFIARCLVYQPTRLVIACRRIDSFFESMYLHSIKAGEIAIEIEEYLRPRRVWSGHFFAALSAVRNLGLLHGMPITRYRRTADYFPALLNAFALSPGHQNALGPFESSNERLGAKAQTVLRHLDMVSGLVGLPLPRGRLIRSFETKRFSFDDEIYEYSVLEHYQRLYLHENALRSAYQFGVLEYANFFQNDRIEPQPCVGLDANLLTQADIAALRDFCRSDAFRSM